MGSEGFQLSITLSDVHLPRMWVEKHPDKDSQVCLSVFLFSLSQSVTFNINPSLPPLRLACWSFIQISTSALAQHPMKSFCYWTHQSPWGGNLSAQLRESLCKSWKRLTITSKLMSFCSAQVSFIFYVDFMYAVVECRQTQKEQFPKNKIKLYFLFTTCHH